MRWAPATNRSCRRPGSRLTVRRPANATGAGLRKGEKMAVSQTICTRIFITGEWTEVSSGKRIPVYDPSTEEVIAEIPDASQSDINAAGAAARHAFDEGGWPQTTAQDRGRILFRIAAKLREEAPLLAELESRNCGKPIVEPEYDIADAPTCL